MTNKITTVTTMFVNKQVSYKKFRAMLFNIDIDAVNLLESFRSTKFSAKWFLIAYTKLVVERELSLV